MTETRRCTIDPADYVLGHLSGPDAEAFRLIWSAARIAARRPPSWRRRWRRVPLIASSAHRTGMPVPRQRGIESERRTAVRIQAQQEKWWPADDGDTGSDGRPRSAGASAEAPPRRGLRRFFAGSISKSALVGVLALTAATALTLVLTFVTSDTTVYPATIAWRPGAAFLEVTNERAELLVAGMPPPAPGHVYEVWVERGNDPPAPTPALFDVTARGRARVEIPVSMQDVKAVFVTEEPRGGSDVVTTQPLLLADLKLTPETASARTPRPQAAGPASEPTAPYPPG